MDPMMDVTDQTMTFEVTANQYAKLERDLVSPGTDRVTHKIWVGPLVIPGTWVVTGTLRRQEQPKTTYWVTLSKLGE